MDMEGAVTERVYISLMWMPLYEIQCMIIQQNEYNHYLASYWDSCLTYFADLEVTQSKTKPLQEMKVTALRDPVSTTCNLVRKHWEHVVQELKWN